MIGKILAGGEEDEDIDPFICSFRRCLQSIVGAGPNTRDSVENRNNKVAALVALTSFRGVWSETMT